MTTLVYNSFVDDWAKGNVVPEDDTFYLLLVTSSYVPDKDAHTKRSDVTNEVSGAGYVAGGAAIACTVASVPAADRETLTFATTAWDPSTITARGGVIYKSRGGAASADELVAYLDFGENKTSANSRFEVSFSAPLIVQN